MLLHCGHGLLAARWSGGLGTISNWATLAQRFYKPNDLKRDQLIALKAAIDKNVTMGERVSLDRRIFTFAPKPEPALPTALTVPPSPPTGSRVAPAPVAEPVGTPTSQFPEVQISD